MGSLFKRKSATPTVPEALLLRCRAEPYSWEVFQEILDLLSPAELCNFYRDLARGDERQVIGLARALAADRKWDLAIISYRKSLKLENRPDIIEELAQTIEQTGRQNEANKVRASLPES